MMLSRFLGRNTALPRAFGSSGGRRAYSSSGYGDQDQTGYGANIDGESPAPTASKEHPGREPVAAGKNTGTALKKGEGRLRGVGPERFAASHGGHRPEPKLGMPHEHAGEGDRSVEQHNREMSERYDHKPHGGNVDAEGDDKVPKEFWAGDDKEQ